ncbi:MAG: hypothetical protein RL291_354 [Pseudomonadota bacterium]
MRMIDASAIDTALTMPMLVDVLDRAFRDGAIAPPRHHHAVPLGPTRPQATWLLMPAIESAPGQPNVAGRYMGMKSVTVFPDNGTRGKPAIFGMYLLLSTETGETLAILDATRLTLWRTAAASALASRYLSRPDSQHLVMLGAGALAPFVIRAHAAVRPIRRVTIWNRKVENARRVAAAVAGLNLDVTVTEDRDQAVGQADIVSAATMSPEPLIMGRLLKPGTHVDCMGAYNKAMRETDDDVVRRASLFADTMAGAFGEAGDFLQPIAAGVIPKEKIKGDLYALARGQIGGRASADEITFFKSVGASIEDLAAAVAVYEATG